MAEEPCGFYAGVFLVLAGMVFILGMGVYSIYNPLKGERQYIELLISVLSLSSKMRTT